MLMVSCRKLFQIGAFARAYGREGWAGEAQLCLFHHDASVFLRSNCCSRVSLPVIDALQSDGYAGHGLWPQRAQASPRSDRGFRLIVYAA